MSIYNVREVDPSGFHCLRREGQVEMFHKPKTGSYIVILYEHYKTEEEPLLKKTLFNKENAYYVFDTVVGMLLEKDPLVPPPSSFTVKNISTERRCPKCGGTGKIPLGSGKDLT